MPPLASLLIPTLRWDPDRGFEPLRDAIDAALALGVGGFLFSGGSRDTVAALARELHERSRIPLLLAAQVERGAGQQFEGCIGLPPFGALGALGDLDAVHRAATVTARELKELGLNWALAPVCDLDVEPGNALVGTRGAGADPGRVCEVITEWIDACQAEGVLACARSFPGHGHARDLAAGDVPSVKARASALWHEDMAPFRAALDAGVASMMAAHAAFPLLDKSAVPATHSEPILTELLRRELKFEGLVASAALEELTHGDPGAEADVAVRAIAAGCDVCLAPADVTGVARALDRAAQQGALAAERVRDALERRDHWATWGRPTAGRNATLDDAMWARQLADRTVQLVRGALPRLGAAVEIVEVDDDAPAATPGTSARGARAVPNRAYFPDALSALDLEAPVVAEPTSNTRVPVIVAAYCDAAEQKGRAGLTAASIARVERVLSTAHEKQRDTLVVLFSHPRNAVLVAGAPNVLCAWGGEPPMQAAAARVIAQVIARASARASARD